MISIHNEGSAETPEIVLDKNTGQFIFSGKSLPENVKDFYKPILKWVEEYIQEPNRETVLVIDLEYFNSSSSKIIINIVELFAQIPKNNTGKLIVNWYYNEDDEDIFEAGQSFSEIAGVPFNLISH